MTDDFRSKGFATRAGLFALRSPFGRRMRASTTELRFRGRRSGAGIALPVAYARDGDRVVVLVGRPATKTWWRNFRLPRAVEVRLPEGPRTGTGQVAEPGTPRYTDARDLYHRTFPRTPADGPEPLVVIDLDAPA